MSTISLRKIVPGSLDDHTCNVRCELKARYVLVIPGNTFNSEFVLCDAHASVFKNEAFEHLGMTNKTAEDAKRLGMPKLAARRRKLSKLTPLTPQRLREMADAERSSLGNTAYHRGRASAFRDIAEMLESESRRR